MLLGNTIISKRYQNVLHSPEVPEFVILSISTRVYCTYERYRIVLCYKQVTECIAQPRNARVCYAVKKYDQSVFYRQEVPQFTMLSKSTTLHSHEVPERNVWSRSTRVYCTAKRYHNELCCQEVLVQRECIVQTRGTGAYRAVKHYQRVLFSRGTRDYFTTKKYRNVFYNQEVPERIVLSKCQPSLPC